jgi:hypothetical protein
MLPKNLFTELEVTSLDNLFVFLKNESYKLECVGYDARTTDIEFNITTEKKSDSLLLFFFENKEEIMRGEFSERVIAEAVGEGNYSFEYDYITLSSTKMTDSEIVIAIDVFNHYCGYDGRNYDKGYDKKSYRFAVPLA